VYREAGLDVCEVVPRTSSQQKTVIIFINRETNASSSLLLYFFLVFFIARADAFIDLLFLALDDDAFTLFVVVDFIDFFIDVLLVDLTLLVVLDDAFVLGVPPDLILRRLGDGDFMAEEDRGDFNVGIIKKLRLLSARLVFIGVFKALRGGESSLDAVGVDGLLFIGVRGVRGDEAGDFFTVFGVLLPAFDFGVAADAIVFLFALAFCSFSIIFLTCPSINRCFSFFSPRMLMICLQVRASQWIFF